MASHNPYRFVVYAIFIIMFATIIIDCLLYPILWASIFFYALTQVLLIFRLFGRNGASIVVHILTTITILLAVYLHYYDDWGVQDYEYYREPLTNYKLVMESESKAKKLPVRTNYIAFWLSYPSGCLICASITGICCILNLSLNVRKMFAALHSIFGLSIAMIYFLICVFYAQYFKTYDVTVTIKIFYYLTFLLVMLCPQLVNYSQILSKYFTEEDDEDEEEQEQVAVVEVEVDKDKEKIEKDKEKIEKTKEKAEKKP